jgi:hypothetical protein
MTSFDTTTDAYKLIAKLAALRKNNPAIAYGTTMQRWINSDVYIFERAFAGSVVLVAINKSETAATPISGLFSSLPAGAYNDFLGSALGGFSVTVKDGGGNNPVTDFSLPAHTVSIWTRQPATPISPVLASVGPDVAQPGVQVTLAGSFSGSSAVKFGSTPATIASSSNNQILVNVPAMPNGNSLVTVTGPGGRVSNGIPFTVLANKLIPVTFTVRNAARTSIGDYIFLTGDTVELGNWSTTYDGAVGPMLTPNFPDWFLNVSVPAGRTLAFKFIKIAADNTVTWENGPNHTFTVPASGTASVGVDWQN